MSPASCTSFMNQNIDTLWPSVAFSPVWVYTELKADVLFWSYSKWDPLRGGGQISHPPFLHCYILGDLCLWPVLPPLCLTFCAVSTTSQNRPTGGTRLSRMFFAISPAFFSFFFFSLLRSQCLGDPVVLVPVQGSAIEAFEPFLSLLNFSTQLSSSL